jgi:hypothetical protein
MRRTFEEDSEEEKKKKRVVPSRARTHTVYRTNVFPVLSVSLESPLRKENLENA